MKTLILGGARSGKSAWAERWASDLAGPVTVIATACAGDAEMAARIAHHRAQRPAHWTTVEEPLDLAAALVRHAGPGRVVIVDCLTVWLSNLLCGDEGAQGGHGPLLMPETADKGMRDLLRVIDTLDGEIALVANEVGMGVVPMGALTRRFVDEAGRLNQRLAQRCERVVFVAAGLPLALKGSLP